MGWWVSQPEERYWLEITDREDLGVNLKAPQTNEDGQEYWSYSLIRAISPGDIVFHYHKSDQAIVAVSRVAGAARQRGCLRVRNEEGTTRRVASAVPAWC